jgi:uncharacterized protein (TIGR04562 family)
VVQDSSIAVVVPGVLALAPGDSLLITVPIGSAEVQRAFRFFYPYEIQVMDYETYIGNLTGPMAHDEYKNRQRKKARDRVLGIGIDE